MLLLSRKHSSWYTVKHSSLLTCLKGCAISLAGLTPPHATSVPVSGQFPLTSSNVRMRTVSISPAFARKGITTISAMTAFFQVSGHGGSIPHSMTRAYSVGVRGRPNFQVINSCNSSSTDASKRGPDLAKGTDGGKDTQMTIGERALQFVGWFGGFYSRKAVLTRSSKNLYESCIDAVETEAFFRALNLPDTFQSWFLVIHLHLWLCLVRLKREGKDGKFMARELVSTFWEDVKQRMSILGVRSGSVASWSMKELEREFYGLIIAYEEGLLSDDKCLSDAIRRNLIVDKTKTDPAQLARMVAYIRKQVHHMDEIQSQHILTVGSVKLLPLVYEHN